MAGLTSLPRKKNINGQPHKLAYITEADEVPDHALEEIEAEDDPPTKRRRQHDGDEEGKLRQ